MMRYQRVSPDCLAIPNSRKQSSSIRACSEADASGRTSSYSAPFDSKPLRVRSGSGSANPTHDHFPNLPSTSGSLVAETTKPNSSKNLEVVLQWGHNKRSRGSRAENRSAGDESSLQSRHTVKVQRRAAIAGAEKIAAAAAAAMPPPSAGGYTRGANLRPCTPLRDSTGSHHASRNMEERSGGQSRSEKRSPPSPPERAHHSRPASVNGFGPDPAAPANPDPKQVSDQDAGGAHEKQQLELPRIYISLSRKEKEDDFLAMKGTKLPQRPKKRAKIIEKSLQYCFPGMWLSDLTRGRYEVREKKCVKKQKRRGLKGMESMDSDSE